MWHARQFAAILAVAALIVSCGAGDAPPRPSLIANAAPTDVVHYFGVGSNMLKSKIVNRGLNGSKIALIAFRPAVVRGHRLAFNMRGFPPLEVCAFGRDVQRRGAHTRDRTS